MKRMGKKTQGILLLALLAVIAVVFGLNGFYIDIIWYKKLGYLQVFFKELVTKLQLGIPLFVVLSVLFYFLIRQIEKNTPKAILTIVDTEREKRKKGIIKWSISIVISLLCSVFISQTMWYKLLEFSNATPFGLSDPIYNKELSFYVFKLPFYQQLLQVGFLLLFVCAVITVGTLLYTYIRNSGIELFLSREPDGDELKNIGKRVWEVTSKHLILYGCLFLLLLAVSFYLKRYDLLYSDKGIGHGASYTDVKIMLPLYWTLCGLSVLGALGVLLFGKTGKIRNLVAIPILLVAVVFLGNVAAYVVNSYVVAPNQLQKELPYMTHNINYTRQAYQLNGIEVKEFNATEALTAQSIRDNALTINNIPINDAEPTLDMYNSLQGIRQYYEFVDIDVDRYYFNGEYRQVFLGVREMNNDHLADNAKTWINQHLKYTHGFGVAISPVNEVTSVGQPALALKDIPPVTQIPELNVEEPRVYFGERTDTYAIVNAKTDEFDYPMGNDNAETQYKADTGLSLKGYNRIAFAINEKTIKILFSSDINKESQILIRRNVMQRVKLLAPFLYYDNDPYIAIANGKLYWIIEGYTTTDKYPYSEPYSKSSANNYMRNSVKAVMDAYTGETTFYLIDATDPIAQTYNKIYNGIFKPIEEMDSAVRAHLKYPKAYFDVQREIYKTYHMINPEVFYNKEDQWEVANQIYGVGSEMVPVDSAYTVMKLPDRGTEFLLMSAYTPRGKDNMVAWIAGGNDGEEYGKLLVYVFSKQSLVYGPMQMEKRIDQDTIIAPQLTLLSQQGSSLIRGNLMTIPIDNNLIYIEPIYLQATSSGEQNIPELKKVIVAYGDRIVMADSLSDGLVQIFGKGSEQQGGRIVGGQAMPTDIAQLAAYANELFQKAEQAQKNGDWAAYGEYMNQLRSVLNQMAPTSATD